MVTAAESQGLSPGYKFDPTDEMLVELFLLPFLRREGLPLSGVVFLHDTRILPPWTLLDRHGLDVVDGAGAYFISPAVARRQSRSVAGGGRWVKQQRALREGEVAVGGEAFRWVKSSFSFHRDGDGRSGATGWVMHEISVVPPPGSAIASTHTACRIFFSGKGRNRKRVPDGYVVGVNQEYAFVPQQQQSSQDCFLQEPLVESQQFLDQMQSNQGQEYGGACYTQQNNQDQEQSNQEYFPEAEQSNQQFLDQLLPALEQSNQDVYIDQNLCYIAPEQQQQQQQNNQELVCEDLGRLVFQGDATQWQQPDGLDGGGGALSWREYMDDAEMQRIIDGLLED
uniref:NAC domain-containing protein n=1 Tax=Leersia perrieri TaxID=77586 RepID=A0A0D9VF10_9ORYZ